MFAECSMSASFLSGSYQGKLFLICEESLSHMLWSFIFCGLCSFHSSSHNTSEQLRSLSSVQFQINGGKNCYLEEKLINKNRSVRYQIISSKGPHLHCLFLYHNHNFSQKIIAQVISYTLNALLFDHFRYVIQDYHPYFLSKRWKLDKVKALTKARTLSVDKVRNTDLWFPEQDRECGW